MTCKELLARLEGVRRSGSGWIARCPAHPDRNPSLNIREVDGKLLIYCHAECTAERVCAALGIKMQELFTDSRPAPQIVATYDYSDENGVPLFQVVRFEPKSFRQRRPEGKGWAWNLRGIRRVVYRLSEVLRAQNVIICEGEKDVETARGLGLVATCNPCGAGSWREEYSEVLRGKRIAIIADADDAGRKHAQQVAHSLASKVESLKVAELPGSKDLSEWIEKGGNREVLEAYIEEQPEWRPSPQQGEGGFSLTPLADLLAQPDAPVEYLWEGRFVTGTVSAVVAKPKVGKSTFARNLCLAVARGEEFLGFATKQGACIYLALEERAEDIRKDFAAMGADGTEPILIHAAAVPAAGIAAVCELVKAKKPALVVIDPLFRLTRVRDEKAYAETYAALGPLIDVARETGTHVHAPHHSGKSQKADPIDSPLGSTAIGGAVATLVVLKRKDALRTIQTVQRIGQEMSETVLNFDEGTRRLSLGLTRFEADRQECEARILEWLEHASGPQTQEAIRGNVEGQARAVRAALTALVKAGKVRQSGEGVKGKPFLYEFENSGSPFGIGTRKPESQNGAKTNIDTGVILVPGCGAKPIVVPCSAEGAEPALEVESVSWGLA